ncbi:MAG TPA: aspartate aminotransferase family protein [Dehalococcoidia bacterium]|nr:aspartate aminotransferase family protein [Dehalococcoidia bacterium]
MAEWTEEEIVELEEKHFLPVSKRQRVTLVRGEGTYVWDMHGKKYLDFVAGIAAVSLGHCHPEVVKAIERQSIELMHTSNYYYTLPQVKLAKLLCEGSGLDKVFFCNSGAEAVEGCIKVARKWGKEKRDGAFEIIVAEGAFHGRTMATVTAAGTEKYREPFAPLLPGIVRVPFNDLEAIKKATTGKTAAVLLEPIQGEGGVNVPDDDYLPGLRKWCDEAGILLMLDEVQTGVGRTGKLFAYQYYGIEPDCLAVAKALGGGFPIGAFLAKDHCAVLGPGEHGTTFGGNALACEVGYAVLKYMLDHDIPGQAAKRGEYVERKLHTLADKHPMVTEIRGRGLIWAIELDRAIAEEARDLCGEAGLLINNVKPTALRIIPPLTVTEDEIDSAVAIVDRVLGQLEKGTPK